MVHNLFHRVLKCVLKLGDDIIAPRDPQFRTMHDRLRNRRFFSVLQRMCRGNRWHSRSYGCAIGQVHSAFVLAGWPGSVHDMRVFDDAMTTYKDVFPHPPIGIQLVHSSIFLSN